MRGAFCRIALVVASFGIPLEALACSCGPVEVRPALEGADFVFAGVVSDVQYIDPESSWEPRIIVEIQVRSVWKGDVPHVLKMHTMREASSCHGLAKSYVEKGKKLLVYGEHITGKFWKEWRSLRAGDERSVPTISVADDAKLFSTNICSRTTLLEHAAEDLQVLGVGTPPV
jgi:hypothetical protein